MKKLVTLLLALAMLVSASSMAMAETSEPITIKIGASSSPHAEILEYIKPALLEKGIDLQIEVFLDYVTPNMSLSDGSLDANYFQHIPYMEQYNASQDDAHKLAAVIGVHYEPYALYAGKVAKLEDLKDGDTITVPNDAANEARALILLESAGLIKLKEGAGIEATINDIEEYIVGIKILEIEAAQLPRTLGDVAMAVINGNYAIEAGFKPSVDGVFMEPADSAAGEAYTNNIVVRADNTDAEWIETFREVLCSKDVYDYIMNNEDYAGGVIPSFTVEEAE